MISPRSGWVTEEAIVQALHSILSPFSKNSQGGKRMSKQDYPESRWSRVNFMTRKIESSKGLKELEGGAKTIDRLHKGPWESPFCEITVCLVIRGPQDPPLRKLRVGDSL